MDKKFYRETIDSIKISHKAVDEAIEKLHSGDTVGKVIKMEKPKHFKLKAAGMAAAVLALVVALSAVFYPYSASKSPVAPKNKNNNSFFITANAAEATNDEAKSEKITSNDFVKIGEVVPTVGFLTYDVGDNDISNDRMVGLFNYDLKCEGNNIDKVTYKIDNATFCVKNGYKPVIDKDGQNDLFKLYGLTVGEEGEYGAYYSYTVDYDNQPDLSKYADDITAPLQILGGINEKEQKGQTTKVHGKAKWSEYYNSIFNDTVITVTVTFKDGTEQSQKLQLQCDYKDDKNILVNAKVIE